MRQLLLQTAMAVVDTPPVSGTIRRLAARDKGRSDQLAVLTYHRVAEPDDQLYPGLISATPTDLARQAAWLAKHYRVLSLAEVAARREGGDALPQRSVLLTFDDAYGDFGTYAWPILKAHGLPAALYVPTAYVDDPGRAFWWDRLHRAITKAPAEVIPSAVGELDLRTTESRSATARRVRGAIKDLPHDAAMARIDAVVDALDGDSGDGGVLSWEALQGLVDDGVEIGVHTRTHPLLDRLPVERLDEEIGGARDDLERRLGRPVVSIAYPNGNHSPAVLAAVAAAGLRLGFTTHRGTNDLRRPDWLAMRRINVGRATSPSLLAAQLHRWFRFWP